MSLILFILILTVYGVTNIIVYGKIFQWLRTLISKISTSLYNLVTCMMCTGFWVGVLLTVLILIWLGFAMTWWLIIPILFAGGFFSGTTWLIHTIQEYFEK